MPGGALAVPGGDEIVPLVNRLGARFANVVLTQDWHPRDHISFASAHPGHRPFETIRLRGAIEADPSPTWSTRCGRTHTPRLAIAA